MVSITPAGKADVYCLDAEFTHAFAVNNGVVVHNCYDEIRYMCMTRPMRPKVQQKVITGTFQSERAKAIKAKKMAARYGLSIQQAYERA